MTSGRALILVVVVPRVACAGIARQLWLTAKTVEAHVRSILGKLDLPPDGDTHRRVVAVLTYLRASAV